MTLAELAAAILVLLATPGPTNTLVALAGAERSWTGALRLIPTELAGYLVTTVPLALAGTKLLEAMPAARGALTVVAAAWVLWLAMAMWRLPALHIAIPAVTGRRIFVTTLLNPKALVFGIILLPAEETVRLVANFAVFAALVVAVAMGWAALGAALCGQGHEGGLPRVWRRAASLWLGALAAYLLGRVAGLA